jgi:hypothetical protein
MDRWIPLTADSIHTECLSTLLGLSPATIKLMARERGFPLRRPSERGTPGVIQSEFLDWMREQTNE